MFYEPNASTNMLIRDFCQTANFQFSPLTNLNGDKTNCFSAALLDFQIEKVFLGPIVSHDVITQFGCERRKHDNISRLSYN